MIDGLLRYSLNNRLLILVAAAIVVVLGFVRASDAPIDVFPDVSAPTVAVVAEAPGMPPEEMERLVTFPLETAINSAPGVRRVRSSTSLGIAVVWADFDWGAHVLHARQTVAEKLQLVAGELPLPPILAPQSSVMGEIMFLAARSDSLDPRELRTIADWQIRPRLLAVSGVAQVIPIGGERRQLEVVLDPRHLQALEVPVDDVITALEASNENTSAGVVIDGGKEWIVRGLGRVHDPRDLEDVVVARRDDRPITLRELGTVRMGNAFKRGVASFNAEPAVIIGVHKQPEANTLELTYEVEAVLDDLEAALPEGVELKRGVLRQADFIEVAVDNVLASLRDGAVLVVLIVLPFLVSVPATLITGLAIPLSLLVTVLVLEVTGNTIDTMSLGGMAIAVGAVVDDAIIDVENVVRRLRINAATPKDRRRSAFDVVLDASREIRTSIVFATLVIALVFLPLFFLGGVEGRLLRPLGLAYVVALMSSLAIALTVTPVLCYYGLPTSRAVHGRGTAPLVRWLVRGYAPLLRRVLPRWKSLAIASALLVTAAGGSLLFAGRGFLPSFNEGALTISVVATPGITLPRSDDIGRRAERVLIEHPAVGSIGRRTGRAALDEHALGTNISELDVQPAPGVELDDHILDEFRELLASVPGATATIGQPISHRIDHMLSGTRANIAVKVFGNDLRELRAVAEDIRAHIEPIEGVVDLSVEQQADVPQIHVRFDRRALARHAMTLRNASTAVQAAFLGAKASTIVEGQSSYDLIVRYEEPTEGLDAILQTPVTTPLGATVPLHALATIERSVGPNTISRENVQRKLVVMCNVVDRDLMGVVEDIRATVSRDVAVPGGVRVEYGGQFESATRATRVIAGLSVLVAIGVFVLLASAFDSPRDALLVLVNLPLALVGGVAGMWLTGGVVTVASMVGFIALFGIATRNGIMLVSHVRHVVVLEGETDPTAGVRRAAEERLAPILMTAVATGLGLAPLALSLGEAGGEIQAPMAIVILCGLAGSTALNMLVLPSLYLRFGKVVARSASAR